MDGKTFVITAFLSASKPINHQGRSFYIHGRPSAALIFPIYGKLEFSYGTEVIHADFENPVFIPKGMCYRNKCIEDAQSLMLNIQVQDGGEKILPLLPLDTNYLQRIYDEITMLNVNPTGRKQTKLYGKLYQLISECLPYEPRDSTSILSPALEMIEKSYHNKELNLDDLAAGCNISKPYLHKLFKKEFEMTPFQYITQTRMRQAKTLLQELYPVGEVASMVGYSDIYQFSRAFKRFYKCSPDKIRKETARNPV